MKKICSIVLLGLLFPCFVFAQGETSNWLFGNGAGIRFNNDGSISNINKSKLNTIEGCATISDSFGKLLFYTDGITVYNSNHEIMLNGEGLYGDPSSTQSALIVPKPEDPELFYIFTVDTSAFAEDPDFGLNYSVVDISLDNGLGAVTVKNTNLLQDCSEKITAVVKDCFEQSIWVVTLASQNGVNGDLNTFYAYEVNASGVNSSPVKTTFPTLQIGDPRGYLKFSPDAISLAVANFTDGISYYDFDANTGLISNPVAVELPGTNINAYGLEFSPNSQFLYIHATNNSENNGDHSSSLFQIDTQSADINASIFELDNRPIYRGALQQGENGKIYRTITNSYNEGTPYLGVIDKPNEAGVAADYQHNAIDLGGKITMQGLPPFIQSFFGNTALVRNDDGTTSSTLSLCSGEPLELEADSIPGALYAWEKDGIPLTTIDTRTLNIASTSESDSGRYRVVITPADPNECPTIGESLIYVLPIPDPSIELTQCDIGPDDPSDGISIINLDGINQNSDLDFYFYESEADRDSDLPISDSANYQNTQPFSQVLYYKVVNTLGCSNLGELNLIVTPSQVMPSNISPVYSCDDDPENGKLESYFDLDSVADRYTDPLITVQFYYDISDAALQQNPILDPELITESITLYARLSEGNQCMGIETVDLIVNPSPIPTMAETYVLCTDLGSAYIEGPEGFDSYRWYKKTGSGNVEIGDEKDISLNDLGFYELETSYVYNINGDDVECGNKTSFQLIPSSRAVINEIEINDFSSNNILEISVQGEGNYEYSLDGTTFQASPVFSNLSPGFYTSYVRDKEGCGITQKDVAVMGYPKFFTPNGDGVNDFWQLDGLSELFQANAFVGIYDRYGSFVTQIGVTDRGWNGTVNSRTMPADDYWFKVQLVDGREVQGHFTLKR
ncbi:MAG: T9SS type B sorting domain-containing protein [Muriicola sp.]|nr:T9SS type B sorting domain-containing protein [Muriicola sp.]NNK09733.1 T9SS type B sorting domain-containing protein [Flavobacteriaceae bacterium]